MNYGEVLSRAWQITWKYKILWLFGILAGCGSQVGRNSSFSYQYGGGPGGPGGGQDLPPALRSFFFSFREWVSSLTTTEIILIAAGMILTVLLLVAISLVLSTFGKIGLIKGTIQADQGAASLSFGELWGQSRPFFWRVLGLNLLIGLIFLFIGLIFAGLTTITFGLILICLLPILCLLPLLGAFVAIIIEQANVALVVDNLRIAEALARGWQVVRENLGEMVIMGLILLIGISGIGGFIIGLPILVVIIPIGLGVAQGTLQALQTGALIAGLCFVVYLPVLIVLSGILQTYVQSAWTLTFMRLTSGTSGEGTILEAPSY